MRILFIPILSILFLFFLDYVVNKSTITNSVDNNITVIINPGTSSYQIAKLLAEKQIISSALIFLGHHLISFPRKPLIPGEYNFKQHSNIKSVLADIQQGKFIRRKITIPEGWTVHQVVEAVRQINCLRGEIKIIPEEGMILPETYYYVAGEGRQVVINRMREAMDKYLNKLWGVANKANNTLITTPKMLLTLASIIERETSLASERARVAGVFINRLSLKMPLQSDPTVLYALTLGKFSLKRPLNRRDLNYPSPYNTYKVVGLPPGPIACPGKDSLLAVLNPLRTRDIYFVANGNGGHNFSQTLNQHNHHVQNWRKINRQTPSKVLSGKS